MKTKKRYRRKIKRLRRALNRMQQDWNEETRWLVGRIVELRQALNIARPPVDGGG